MRVYFHTTKWAEAIASAYLGYPVLVDIGGVERYRINRRSQVGARVVVVPVWPDRFFDMTDEEAQSATERACASVVDGIAWE